MDIDKFFPRCFDLNEIHEYEEFIEEFKITKAESVLKQFLVQKSLPNLILFKNKKPIDKDIEKARLCIALSICENRIKKIDEIIDNNIDEKWKVVSDADWEILSCDELTEHD